LSDFIVNSRGHDHSLFFMTIFPFIPIKPALPVNRELFTTIVDFASSAGILYSSFIFLLRCFVDDRDLLIFSYSGNPIAITAPYQLKLNVWSSVNRILGPPEEDVACMYLIDWIEFTPYGE
ncbi:MAG: hypothetical protein JXJ04_04785, partial [Spirochaetales bacterium]|nr:hypothetical protein [Spirochaetales bacterium]